MSGTSHSLGLAAALERGDDVDRLKSATLDSAVQDIAWLGTYGTETVAVVLTRLRTIVRSHRVLTVGVAQVRFGVQGNGWWHQVDAHRSRLCTGGVTCSPRGVCVCRGKKRGLTIPLRWLSSKASMPENIMSRYHCSPWTAVRPGTL